MAQRGPLGLAPLGRRDRGERRGPHRIVGRAALPAVGPETGRSRSPATAAISADETTAEWTSTRAR